MLIKTDSVIWKQYGILSIRNLSLFKKYKNQILDNCIIEE